MWNYDSSWKGGMMWDHVQLVPRGLQCEGSSGGGAVSDPTDTGGAPTSSESGERMS